MKIGTYYYPEQWPREQWERDFDNIAAMGLQIVHMAEFAWFSLEPEPGRFDFDWLAQCVEMAQKRKLDVVLCTPTAAPPSWLSQQHPDTLPTDFHGARGRFGGRRHYNPTSPALHDAAARIVTALADCFGQHRSVIGWQIDNEYSGAFDQSEYTHAAFRQWLHRRYETIDRLNTAWGCQFWNTQYTSFDQILMPRDRDPRYANPHHHLDASRFWSWAFANFNRLQAEILKPRVGDRFITSNFMPFHPDCDPRDFASDLNLFGWDSYPVTGWEKGPVDDTYRLADPAAMGFVHDQMRSYTGRWALMEVQLGQTNWSGVPVLLYPGAVRLWLWTAFAHGSEFVTVYRYRQARFGTEMFHHALVGTDGATPSPGGRQFMQVIDEQKRLKSASRPARQSSSAPAVGILFDFEQLWYHQTLPQAKRWDQPKWMTTWYGSLARLGLPMHVLHVDRDWPKDLAVLVVPGMQMVDDAIVKRLENFTSRGGHLVLTCRTGIMDRNGQLFEGPTAAPILPLIGGAVEAYDGLPESIWGIVEMDDQRHRWGAWGELLYAEDGTRVLARYVEHFYQGAAAVLQRKLGSGTVTYCGVYGESSLTDALIHRIATSAKLTSQWLPPRTQLLKRDDHWVFVNFQDAPVEAPAPVEAEFVVGERRVDPAGVAVWRA
jgi:beta-galactosidase